jgi:hypothetical protein
MGVTLEYGVGSAQVAAEASVVALSSKRTRGGGGQEIAQPTLRRCGNCGGTGHNARTCLSVVSRYYITTVALLYHYRRHSCFAAPWPTCSNRRQLDPSQF